MTPEEMKAKLQELSTPLIEFMKEQGVASFYLPYDEANTFDIGADMRPLPPRMKCTLTHYGSIYMVDREEPAQ